MLRIIFLLTSGVFGGIGFAFSAIFLVLNIAAVDAEQWQYTPDLTIKNRNNLTDIFLKSSWRTINKK